MRTEGKRAWTLRHLFKKGRVALLACCLLVGCCSIAVGRNGLLCSASAQDWVVQGVSCCAMPGAEWLTVDSTLFPFPLGQQLLAPIPVQYLAGQLHLLDVPAAAYDTAQSAHRSTLRAL